MVVSLETILLFGASSDYLKVVSQVCLHVHLNPGSRRVGFDPNWDPPVGECKLESGLGT